MTFSDAMFWLFALIAVLPALAILLARSIVRRAFLLLFSLLGIAGLYLHLGAGFVGFVQVLVYIGGILILFLFGVMLTAKVELPLRRKLGMGVLLPAACAGLIVTACLVYLVLQCPWEVQGGASAGVGGPETPGIGLELMSTYVFPFEAVSVLLLVAMVGATYIARGEWERAREEPKEGEG
jgi:NADH-quinone oxidoreductase subunit J